MTNETQFPTLGFPAADADLPTPSQIGEFQSHSVDEVDLARADRLIAERLGT